MSNLVINIPLSRGNKCRCCISCAHCPDLLSESGDEICNNSDDIAKFIKERYTCSLDEKTYHTLNNKIILRGREKGCACPNSDIVTFCQNATLTYSLKYYSAGTIPYNGHASLFGKNILRLIETVVRDDGTLNDMYEHVDMCPGHEFKDRYKTTG